MALRASDHRCLFLLKMNLNNLVVLFVQEKVERRRTYSWKGEVEMGSEKFDIETLVGNTVYSSEVSLDVLKLMMQADVVTIRGKAIAVRDVEVTDTGIVRFHGSLA